MVIFKFYAKEKGKWVQKTHERLSPGTSTAKDIFTYAEVMKNGTYAATATVDRFAESDKTFFKIKNVGKNKSPYVFKEKDYVTEAMKYKALMDVPVKPRKNTVRVEWNYQSKSTWQLHAILYYVDAKGKLHLVDKKPLKFYNDGGIHRNEATFKTVKGQRDYALAQANRDGKILGYDFFHYDKGQNQVYTTAEHAGHPSASMKFKKSDWRRIEGYYP